MAAKTNAERVTVSHAWRDGVPEFVVLYDKPRSRKLTELKTFESDHLADSAKARRASLAAESFRDGYVAALNDMEK